MAKYSVHQQPVETLLSWIKSGEIAIPEIQRPFVWSATKVRDLMDSLYKGYPVGYIITWRNQDIRLKDGSLSNGKKILIDGQQRITALTAAVVGQKVLNKDYQEVAIRIAYNPFVEEGESHFEVCDAAIEKNPKWINNISHMLTDPTVIFDVLDEYIKDNPEVDKSVLRQKLTDLQSIKTSQIGIIELDSSLDIDVVTEIFIRINQKGVVLSNADFVMSKIASDIQFGGNTLRKMIDYFCHLHNDNSFDKIIEKNDKTFTQTSDYQAIRWITTVNDQLYQPSYVDVLRVAYTYQFNRGKFSDLVALLSGRDFENRRNVESIAAESYVKLRIGLESFFNQTNYQRFLMLIESAGFISKKLLNAQNSLNVAYALFLQLRENKVDDAKIQNLIKRWFVMSLLTGRYSGSSESAIEKDIKQVAEKGLEAYLIQMEQAELDEGFWDYRLVNDLETSSTSNNTYTCYLAAQCKNTEIAFLSDSVTVRSLIEQRGDVHHLFPKKYLEKDGYKRTEYNQVANFAYIEQQPNIKISNDAPHVYMAKVMKNIEEGTQTLTSLKSLDALKQNMAINAIPESLMNADSTSYKEFLIERRQLMAQKIKAYYQSL
ncbi:DUF262 domain-containing protein [Wohlfahrtiimonas chitiniclastica]|uniref:GmrSD restriction endonuclease domain-containing protein n=1 Tax=Wohlfahrtiimonas chitiniclastica TaxID=400946 RepID=UPI0007B3FE03|nr:DUF262 domain-containing protein [Wohlfahrtiimonas chitiniclastica]KZS22744.1 hypothetical protein BMY_0571 [Wohlfahrtiimonas chitiniclastica]WHR55197.1 DUF262 domain-containing protein [Wohlfahrtiimonas chitiniclastica]